MTIENLHLTILRNRHTNVSEFRNASDKLAHFLCHETLQKLVGEKEVIETKVGTTTGYGIPTDVMVVPILRAGLALLPAFTEVITNVAVGILGMERNESNAEVRTYYQKFPSHIPDRAIILDPMLATGNSAILAVAFLVSKGLLPKNIYFTGVVASEEGYNRLARTIPVENITLSAIDPELNEHKYIVPGLGDYGDRYFGTSN